MRRVTLMVAAMVVVTVLVVASGAFAEQAKVPLCHEGQTITVGAPAKATHLNHGDSPEPCEQPA